MVEKFSDADSSYQIVKRVENNEYETVYKEMKKYEQNSYADSIIQGVGEYEKSNAGRNEDGNSTISNDGYSDRNIHTMAQNERSGRKNIRNETRDSSSSNLDKQKFSISDDVKIVRKFSMKKLLTEEQFVRVLNISTQCAKNKWKHSTDMKIASLIAKAQNKEDMISKIEKIVEMNNEQEVLEKLEKLK